MLVEVGRALGSFMLGHCGGGTAGCSNVGIVEGCDCWAFWEMGGMGLCKGLDTHEYIDCGI